MRKRRRVVLTRSTSGKAKKQLRHVGSFEVFLLFVSHFAFFIALFHRNIGIYNVPTIRNVTSSFSRDGGYSLQKDEWSLLSLRARKNTNPEQLQHQQNRTHKISRSNNTISTSTTATFSARHSPECIRLEALKLRKVYPVAQDHSWCIKQDAYQNEGDNRSTKNRTASTGSEGVDGLVLVKVPKAASSTAASAVLRISKRLGCGEDTVNWQHRPASDYRDRKLDRHRKSTFFLTTVRDPGARAVSSIFFHVITPRYKAATARQQQRQLAAHHNEDVTNHSETGDKLVLAYLRGIKKATKYKDDIHYGIKSEGQGGFQLRYASFRKIPKYSAWKIEHPNVVKDPYQVVNNVRQTIQSYDFVLVAERMDESLVVLALLLGIDVGDVIVMDSKVSVAGSQKRNNNYHLFKHSNGGNWTCVRTSASHISPAAAAYLESDEWRAANFGDYLLHEAANLSLDLTINNAIGRDRFDAALRRYTFLKRKVMEECFVRPNDEVVLPCSDDGKPQLRKSRRSCYAWGHDFGCGHKCIDRVIQRQSRQ